MKQHKIGLGIAFGVALGIAASALAQQAVQWRVEDGGNGHWYGLTGQAGTWDQAAEWAEAVGGVLASVNSTGENSFVQSLITTTMGSWIGARKVPGLPWEWRDGTDWGFTLWCPGEPCCGDLALNAHMYPAGCWNDDRGWQHSLTGVIEWSADCNGDGIVDYGQILQGQLADTNSNGIPDICEVDPCPGDVTDNGVVDGVDLSLILALWGTSGQKFPRSDANGDGTVDANDLAIVLSGWGNCP